MAHQVLLCTHVGYQWRWGPERGINEVKRIGTAETKKDSLRLFDGKSTKRLHPIGAVLTHRD